LKIYQNFSILYIESQKKAFEMVGCPTTKITNKRQIKGDIK